MKILYVKPNSREPQMVQRELEGHELIFSDSLETIEQNVCESIEILSVFVDTPVSELALSRFPNLKCIATRSVGFDHIAVEVAKARGIAVVRVPHYGTRTVAEYAFALMFDLSRSAYRSYVDMQKNSGLSKLESYEGFDLGGKTLGVIGTGFIGRSVCQIARGIGMNVVAFDVAPDESFAQSLGFTYASLFKVAAASDIVTVHVPLMDATHHLINAAFLEAMKDGSYLINTARGEVVDTQALIAALQSGHLAGAGLDVLEGERELHDEAALLAKGDDGDIWKTLVADNALIDMPNVIVTPHIAFNTKEAKQEITDITIANIKRFIEGVPQNTL